MRCASYLLSLLFAFSLLVLFPACGDDDNGNGTGGDGQVSGPDGGTNGFSTNLAATGVANTISLPESAVQYALDLDGDNNPDNHFGAILGATSQLFDAQSIIDGMLADGRLVMLFQVFADSLADEPKAKLQAYLGKDTDGDGTDNFSGSEEFEVDPADPGDAILTGSISSSRIQVGPGKLLVPVPFGSTPITVNLIKGQLQAALADSTNVMTGGQINGAVPMSDVDGKIIPAIAESMTEELSQPDANQVVKSMDTDSDGTITAAELKANQLIGMVLKPDIDTDGDGTKDSISIGLGFTAVKAVLK